MNPFSNIVFLILTITTVCTQAQSTTISTQDSAVVYTSFDVDTLGNVTNVKILHVDCVVCTDSSINKMIKQATELLTNQHKWGVALDSLGNKINTRFSLPMKIPQVRILNCP